MTTQEEPSDSLPNITYNFERKDTTVFLKVKKYK